MLQISMYMGSLDQMQMLRDGDDSLVWAETYGEKLNRKVAWESSSLQSFGCLFEL